MHPILLVALFLFTILVFTSTIPVFALPQFGIEQQHGVNQCHIKGAQKIISVAEQVLNDGDLGLAGNVWAHDNYTRDIKVWQQQNGLFCAMLVYHGQFDTISGNSPSGASTVGTGINGTFTGAMMTTVFSGTLNPNMPTNGTIGVYDYKCDASLNCPGAVKWTDQFFSNVSGLDISRVGFTYHGSTHGSMKESFHKATGDITG